MAGHDVGVDVNRIDRIHHRDPVVVAENVEDVRTVAFRTVRNKNLIVSDLDGAGSVIVFRDRVPEKFIALLGSVTVKGLSDAEVVDGCMHCGARRGWQGFGYVADAATNQTPGGIRVRIGERFDAPTYFRK